MLEGLLHSQKCFVTLTYRETNLPVSASGPTLVPGDLQHFLKRLRRAINPLRIRYFACGEYGETSGRPHYHIALFGYSGCDFTWTRTIPGSTQSNWRECCSSCITIGEAWGHGDIHLGELTKDSAQYIAGYVVKKMQGGTQLLLGDRHPEFSRMSLKPGIGLDAMDEVASVILSIDGPDIAVPSGLRHGSHIYPLGRYLRNALKLRLGRDPGYSDEELAELEEKVREVRESAFENSQSFRTALVEKSEGRRATLEARYNIFNGRKKI